MERNYQNAQLSTGPKTPSGKAVSRANSLRHGLCANPAAGVVEDADAFEELYGSLIERLVPRDPLEAGLVHRVATCLWRLQRAAKVDAAIGSLSVTAVVPMRERVQRWVADILAMFMPVYEKLDAPTKRERGLSQGIDHYQLTRPYLTRLDEWRYDPQGRIATDGAAIEAMTVMLKDLATKLADPRSFHHFTTLDAQVMAWLLGESAKRYEPAEHKPDQEPRDPYVYPDEQPWRQPIDTLIGQARRNEYPDGVDLPPELAAAIESRLAIFSAWNKMANDPATNVQAECHRTAALLPDAATLDRLIRYETHADKSLHRALETLAKLRGATVETVMARVSGTTENGTTVEVEGQRTRWTREPADQHKTAERTQSAISHLKDSIG